MTRQLPSPPQDGLRTRRRRRIAAALRAVATGTGVPARQTAKLEAVAERILTLAQAGGVPLGPDVDLAEMLVRLDLGEPVPPEAVVAIAAVLLPILTARSPR